MRTILMGATFGLALMLGAFALFALGENTQAGGSSVDEVAIDMNPTGNTSTSVGTIDPALSDVALNTPVTIDVVVKGVPADGLFGVGFELNYDPAFIKVTAVTMTATPIGSVNVLQFSTAGGSPLINQSDIDTNPGEDADGSLRVDSVGTGPQETGSGRVSAITIECIASGTSALTLTDSINGSPNAAVIYSTNGGGVYSVDTESEASIGCATSVVTPTPGTITPTPVTGTITPTPVTGTITPTPVTGTITPTPVTGTITPTPTAGAGTDRLWGDTDCDGEISTRDNQALLRKVLSQAALSQTEPCTDPGNLTYIDGTERLWGDWDCDGEISTRDNQALLRKVLSQAALSQTEPCPDIGNPVEES